MGRYRKFSSALLALLPASSLAGAEPAVDAAPMLRFEISEGRNINSFVRHRQVAAHLLLRSGADPRIIVAFPAGNSGVGLWFSRSDLPVSWSLDGAPRTIRLLDAAKRPLYGIVAEATAATRSLSVKQALLSSVRVLRDYQGQGTVPEQVLTQPTIAADRITWTRNRLDGTAGYFLSIEVLGGSIRDERLTAGSDGRLRLRITAASGETPLTPLSEEALLGKTANADPVARNAITFLSYGEKFLAGSWRFNTYFGRDTLMALKLLMPDLQPSATEAGLRSVLVRLAPNGEVAHEEDIGEFAILRRMRDGAPSAAPIYDYAMVDDDFMLAPVSAAWLIDDPRGRERAAAFLAARLPGGETTGAALVRNLRWVVGRAAPFARNRMALNLVGLKQGRTAGQWRDSDEGLGRGRYPYDVNAVLVPAALDAADRLQRSGLLDPFLGDADRDTLASAGRLAALWQANAPPLFDVTIPQEQARHAVGTYAKVLSVASERALASLGEGPVRFRALSLDASGRPVPIVHSDTGFELLFGTPSPAAVDEAVSAMMRPFPAGLMTEAGMLVANPVFAGAAAQTRLDKRSYHGTVVWSWQQAVFAAGLERQLRRKDLPPLLSAKLATVQRRLWDAIVATKGVRSSELWSWSYADGRYRAEPFGASDADEDESNAAQLWSTVFLALDPPMP